MYERFDFHINLSYYTKGTTHFNFLSFLPSQTNVQEEGRLISKINCIFFLAQGKVRGLILNERCEIVVPLLYILTFLMAYFGPNAELIGNVKLTIWQYQAVKDINNFLEKVFFLFAIDLFGAVVNGLLLWKTCKINCLKTLKNMQKEFWHIMGVQEAVLFLSVGINDLKSIWGCSYTSLT